MKLRLQRTIPSRIQRVWEEFTTPGNRVRWDSTLSSYETIQGKAGHPGALAHVTHEEDGVAIDTTEWVVERTAPIVYRTVYDSPQLILRLDNRFRGQGDGTSWSILAEARFKGVWLKLLSPVLRLRLRLEREMDDFASYLGAGENDTSQSAPLGSGQSL